MTIRTQLILVTLVLSVASLQAQVSVDNTLTAQQLVEDYLVGEGVQVANITINGQPAGTVNTQAGLYNGPSNVVSFDQGLVMASGNVVDAVTGGFGGSMNNPVVNDSDLVSISGLSYDDGFPGPINDAIIIEFDFLSTSDSIKFNYVFASNEYELYTCTAYNDVFGFFLSGPGINGPYMNNAINIALIPNSNIPVGINTLNGGQATGGGMPSTCAAANPNWIEDSQYFVSNLGLPSGDVQFNGMTKTLTALADVDCGAWYHIKLALGDATDGSLDSGVFLEAGSFAALGDVFVNVSPTIGGAPVVNSNYDSVLVAGCSEAYIQLIRPTGLTVDSVFTKFGGTAVNGEDYELGDNDTLFFFPEGVDTLNFTITTIYDGVPGEGEYLEITVFYFNSCGGLDSSSTTIPIVDPYIFTTETSDVVVTCPADSTFIQVLASDGIEPYKYNWGDLGTSSTIYAEVPLNEKYYVVGVTDACGFETVFDSVKVTNNIPPPLQVSINPFDQPECTNQPIALYTTTQGGNGDYTFIWEDGLNNNYPQNEGIGVENINNILQFNPEPIGYTAELPVYVTVIDTCGTIVKDSIQINYPFFDPMTVAYNPLTDNCPKDPVKLKATTQGGAGDTNFQWAIEEGDGYFPDGSVATTAETYVVPSGGVNQFTVVATDKCSRAGYDYHYVAGNTLAFGGLATYTDSVRVLKLDHLMNVMTPNGDGKNDYFVVEGIQYFDDAQVQIFDRWGRMIYETKNYKAGLPTLRPDGSFDGTDLDDGTYFYVINVDQGECVQSGQIEILRKNN